MILFLFLKIKIKMSKLASAPPYEGNDIEAHEVPTGDVYVAIDTEAAPSRFRESCSRLWNVLYNYGAIIVDFISYIVACTCCVQISNCITYSFSTLIGILICPFMYPYRCFSNCVCNRETKITYTVI